MKSVIHQVAETSAPSYRADMKAALATAADQLLALVESGTLESGRDLPDFVQLKSDVRAAFIEAGGTESEWQYSEPALTARFRKLRRTAENMIAEKANGNAAQVQQRNRTAMRWNS